MRVTGGKREEKSDILVIKKINTERKLNKYKCMKKVYKLKLNIMERDEREETEKGKRILIE